MILRTAGLSCSLAISFTAVLLADDFNANYDEALVPPHELPDVLAGVRDASGWPAKRAEWMELLSREMFGFAPPAMPVEVDCVGDDKSVLNDTGTLRQLTVTLAGQTIDVAIFLPPEASGQTPVPAFLGYNFGGNHTVLADPAIRLPRGWVRGREDHVASEDDRGKASRRWCIEQVLESSFALVTLHYGDVDPDVDDGFRNGVHAVLGIPGDDQAASIATWAWALGRVLDALETVSEIDSERVAVIGHSRLGKTALWAGATDPRFALVISNNSGCGGAALSRRRFGETVERINRVFPHWFNARFKRYGDNEDALPFDSHVLLAMIAPRPLYVASAEGDRWADPRGEFLSCVAADPVYRLLGRNGLPSPDMPAVDAPVEAITDGTIGYHIRSGPHDITPVDWQRFLAFARRHLIDGE